MKPRIVFLVGPTATGKTDIAVSLAKKINAEIISCDSMQIYKGMDIITSKPPVSLRKRISHYLINLVSADKEYNVSQYRKQALKAIKKILKKKKTPLFVGGSGLYMSVLIDGIFKAKPENKTIRKQLYKLAEGFGSHYLYNRLKKVDQEAALRIHPNDAKRIIRGLEVFQVTGKPISLLQKHREGLSLDYDIKIFCLNMERDKLYQRIQERLDKMFAKGLVREVKDLLKLKLSRTASCAIGIKELKGYFDGLYGLTEAKRLMKRNTCAYAKRQLTWFRKDKRINWINIKEEEDARKIAKRILKEIQDKSVSLA